jgi:hypothetical protein
MAGQVQRARGNDCDLDLRHFPSVPSESPSAEPKPGPGVAHTMSLEQPFIESKPEEPDAGAIASS